MKKINYLLIFSLLLSGFSCQSQNNDRLDDKPDRPKEIVQQPEDITKQPEEVSELEPEKTTPTIEENKPEDIQDKTIKPISPNKDVTVFFEEHLPTPYLYDSECIFVSEKNDKVLVVNSEDKLKEIISCTVNLPIIDFDIYTLIIGQKIVPESLYSFYEQDIVVTEVLELNIYVPDIGYYQAFSKMYYWGLYPKLPEKDISVNIKKIKYHE